MVVRRELPIEERLENSIRPVRERGAWRREKGGCAPVDTI